MEVTESGVIYRNPLPGHRAVIAYAPHVLPLGNGEFLAVFRHGQAMYSPDGEIHQVRSVDNCESWQHEGPIHARAGDDSPYNYRAGQLTLLRDGRLAVKINRAQQPDPQRLYFNPDTGGLSHCETLYAISTDQGRSWSEPVHAAFPDMPEGLEPAADGPVIELHDGRWMQIIETWKSYDNTGSHRNWTFALFSDDEGLRWGDWTDVANGTDRDRSYSHGSFVALADGTMEGMLWTGNLAMDEFYDLHAVHSADAGRTWSTPTATGIPGQTSALVVLSDGRRALAYSHRDNTEQPGIKLIVSDDGVTWDHASPLILWDAYGKEALGVSRTDMYPGSHDAIAYGAPQLAVVDDGDLLASFWCTQSSDTHARWVRVSV